MNTNKNTNKKWDDASEKDLLFAMLMSTGDGNCNIKADWQKVEKIMTSLGYNFTIGAMSQHWSKTIQKAFKERYQDIFKDGDDTNPATPSKEGAGPRTPKTPAPGKGKGKGRKRAAPSDDEDEDASPKSGAAKKTPRTSAKKMKYSEDPAEHDENQAVVKDETVDDD